MVILVLSDSEIKKLMSDDGIKAVFEEADKDYECLMNRHPDYFKGKCLNLYKHSEGEGKIEEGSFFHYIVKGNMYWLRFQTEEELRFYYLKAYLYDKLGCKDMRDASLAKQYFKPIIL